jgi:hypothetical protein
MSDPFLEEQLKRLREMTERISEAHNKVNGLGRPASADRPSRDSDHAEPRPGRRTPATHRRR